MEINNHGGNNVFFSTIIWCYPRIPSFVDGLSGAMSSNTPYCMAWWYHDVNAVFLRGTRLLKKGRAQILIYSYNLPLVWGLRVWKHMSRAARFWCYMSQGRWICPKNARSLWGNFDFLGDQKNIWHCKTSSNMVNINLRQSSISRPTWCATFDRLGNSICSSNWLPVESRL